MDRITIYYDGMCPFCSRYVQRARLIESAGQVDLIDLRSADAARRAFRQSGIDTNRDMVVEYGGERYAGADAMTLLASLTTPSDAFNRVIAMLFRTPERSRRVYPVMRSLRAAALWLLRRPPIRD